MALSRPAAQRPEVDDKRSVPEKPTVAPIAPAQRMSWRGRIIALLFVLAVAGVTAASIRPKPPAPVHVQTIAARVGSITRIVTAGGKLQAATQVKLSSNITGDLLTLTVKEGDVVKAGQSLGTIDSRRYAAQVAQSEASRASAEAEVQQQKVQVAQTQAEAKRVERLVSSNTASVAELEKAKTEVLAAEARLQAAVGRLAQTEASLREARHAFGMTTLTAPIDGVVTKREKQVGERVRGSDFSEDVILIISTLSKMEMKMEVGEQEVVYLKEGESAEVEVDALPDQKFAAKVVEVARNATVKNAGTEGEVTTFFVRLALTAPSASALPGMSAQASVFTDTRNDAVVVPIQAVTVRPESELKGATGGTHNGPGAEVGAAPASPGGRKTKRDPMQKVVFVVDDGTAKLRRVETGLASDTELEIVSGLKPGEKIVEGPYRVLSRELADGKNIEDDSAKDSSGATGEKAGASK